jgi:integrase/recombinase XerD
VDESLSVSALVTETRERLLRTQHTPLSLQKYETVWRELQQFSHDKQVSVFTRELGATFLAHRYGLVLGSEPWSAARRDQNRLRAIEVLLDCQAHHPVSIRRRMTSTPFQGSWAPLMNAFVAYEKRAGRAARTMEIHLLYLARFSEFLDAAGVADPAALDARVLTEFVSQTGRQHSRSTLYCTSCLLRTFLRYLHREGYTARNLAVFVPPVAGAKKSHVPSSYGAEDIARLLAAVDRANPKGRRDYAMILLACRLGLRASDICRLTFDSFQWDTNTLVITQQKTGQPLTLPLLAEVGTAIIEYLKYGRPAVDSPTIFLRHTAPVGPLTPPTLHSIVSQYLTRAGVAAPPGKKRGPHALRHSLASELLRHETPLPVISAVLGHQDSRTTGTYLTIDLTQLRKLALEVPPVRAGWWGGVAHD